MFRIVSAREAIDSIPSGATIGINSFLALSNPALLHDALTDRVRETGSPRDLTLFCAAGFGGWDETRFADPYIALGAVRRIVAGHYASSHAATRMIRENKIEAFNLPLGAASHTLRAAAAGDDGILSDVGLNLFLDPRIGTCAVNERSRAAGYADELVRHVEIAGRETLYYKAPRIDVAFIKGTSCDPNGNISMENEYLTVDALAMAQAARRAGGKVIVQVDRVTPHFTRPRSVIVPGILVDYVSVDDAADRTASLDPAMDGDLHVPASHMDYFMSRLSVQKKPRSLIDESADIIGARAARELKPGDVVNIGIGIPETVGRHASKVGILKDITMTVESGGVGGLPAPGLSFGATIGADMICDMGSQFDFYDGGGLSVCFMGALEVDRYGNVNAHQSSAAFTGLGGFANITNTTPVVVFCMTFTTKGLEARRKDGRVEIVSEGSIKKVVRDVAAISFSAKNALRHGQRVLYVTERCVFQLTERGLALAEVYDGIDPDRDIQAHLDFNLSRVCDTIDA
ncbi:MAG: propionate CoA-transferase [Oscillospiraceae bacterium]|jgi:propionate CoA-transferase|nr:propionate CoA-transferase [Oscillospiraceae bacterium]